MDFRPHPLNEACRLWQFREQLPETISIYWLYDTYGPKLDDIKYNKGCYDVSKSRVNAVHLKALGYSAQVDPVTCNVPFLEKPEFQCRHNEFTIKTENCQPREGYTNVILPYWICEIFVDHMTKGGRIINVSSQFAGDLDLNDVEFKTRPYDNKTAYRASKQALRMLTVGLSQDTRYKEVFVNSIHPGGVRSKLSDDLNIGADDTAQLAAESIYYLATSPEVEGITGKYFEYKHEVECQFSKDQDKINELMQLLKTY